MSLLCFDEFQVIDVADAIILKQLFSTLFQYGTIVVVASNRLPTDLYEVGINRSYFSPFIGLLEHHCIVHKLQSNLDDRKILSQDMDSFFFVGPQNDKLDEVFERLLNGATETSMNDILVGKVVPLTVCYNFSLAHCVINSLARLDGPGM